MALFPRVHVWVSNEVLTAAALNAEFDNILNNAMLSSWIGFSANVSQMQQQTDPGGVGTESLAGSGSDELQRLRYMMAFVTGKTYWYDHTGRSLATGALAVQTADIVSQAVTTDKINNQAVTATQVANATLTSTQMIAQVTNVSSSSSSGSYTTTQTTPTAVVTNLSVNYVATGRYFVIALAPDGTLSDSWLGCVGNLFTVRFYVTAGPSLLATMSAQAVRNAPGSFTFVSPGLAPSTYDVYCVVYANFSGTVSVLNTKLIVYEIL